MTDNTDRIYRPRGCNHHGMNTSSPSPRLDPYISGLMQWPGWGLRADVLARSVPIFQEAVLGTLRIPCTIGLIRDGLPANPKRSDRSQCGERLGSGSGSAGASSETYKSSRAEGLHPPAPTGEDWALSETGASPGACEDWALSLLWIASSKSGSFGGCLAEGRALS